MGLSPTTAPFPQKLVDNNRLGKYIEMRDLLTDHAMFKIAVGDRPKSKLHYSQQITQPI